LSMGWIGMVKKPSFISRSADCIRRHCPASGHTLPTHEVVPAKAGTHTP
jgi:hypothetical protein